MDPDRTDTSPGTGAPWSRLEQWLRLISDVRPGEGRIAASLSVAVLLLLAAYYVLKPVRDGFLAASDLGGLTKAELKAYASLAQGLALLALMPLYSRLAARWSKRSLLTRANLFFALHLLVFWALQSGLLGVRIPAIGIAFYVWVGVFNLAVIAQFWVFATDIYSEDRGRRVFPVIALGASIGAVMGAWVTGRLAAGGLVATHSLLLIAVVLLSAATVVMQHALPAATTAAAPTIRAQHEGANPLALLLQSKYLVAAALVMTVLHWVGTNGETLLFASVQTILHSEVATRGLTDAGVIERYLSDQTTAFYGSYFFWTNSIALLLQALVVSRLVRFGGFSAAVMALPVVVLLSHSAAATVPVLGVLKVLKITENATLHSISNTAHQLLWLPTTSEMKYKAKMLVDTVFVRLGDVLSALTLFVGTHLLQASMRSLYVMNVVLGLLWLGGAVLLALEHHRMVRGRTLDACC